MTNTTDTSPEAVERFHASEFSADMIPAPRGDYVRYENYAALSAERDALKAELAEAVEMLQRYEEELRLIRMKDTGALYDVLLRADAAVFLARHQKETGE